KHFLVCTEGVQELDELFIEESRPGFVFAPFDTSKKKLFLTADIVYSFSSHDPLEGKFSEKELHELNHEFQKETKKELVHFPVSVPAISVDQSSYLKLVQQSIDFIRQGHAEKIVPSRSMSFELKSNFDVVETFDQLCELYPNAMVSLVSIPDVGTWIGVTPELLVSIDSAKCFKTTALAGTQAYNDSIDLREVTWTQKDIEEQALVSRYIINCFKRIRLRDFKEHGPKSFVAGNLIHLKTDFEADIVGTGFSQLGSQMLGLLHPTSAVCGTPLDASKEFLRNFEGFDREFYSGFLGPVNFQNETQLFVNIRCLQLTRQGVILYAGAGVTLDSVPEKEWEETEMKMDTLLRVITS
ncbi:MAG TPA: chorismate-binding protein, partial [Cyclobacteriaceae bacterium]|nr:chorismate-binding protein [Cyclobacteriaceae bacterium]